MLRDGPSLGGLSPRLRMDLRGIMRSISLLEPPDLGSHPETGDLPEVRRVGHLPDIRVHSFSQSSS